MYKIVYSSYKLCKDSKFSKKSKRQAQFPCVHIAPLAEQAKLEDGPIAGTKLGLVERES